MQGERLAVGGAQRTASAGYRKGVPRKRDGADDHRQCQGGASGGQPTPLCARSKGWPLGELNVPRALVTEKAFPESETVLTTTVNAKGAPAVSNELDYERVLGKRDQLELAVPFGWVHKETGGMTGGLGDIAIGDKHVLYSHLNDNPDGPLYESTGSILSVQGEVVLATGDQRRGLGDGEPSLGFF